MEFNLSLELMSVARNASQAFLFFNILLDKLDLQLLNIDNEIRIMRDGVKKASTLSKKLDALKIVSALEKKRSIMRHEIFDAQEIIEDEYQKRLEQLSA